LQTIIGPISSLFDMTTFALGLYYYKLTVSGADPPTEEDNHHIQQFQTQWFMVSQHAYTHAL